MERITGRGNALAVHMKKLGAQRSYREECGQFLCDGTKLLEEAVKSGAEILAVLCSSSISFPLPAGARVCSAPRDLIDSLSPLKNAQDTLFVCKMPPSGGFVGAGGTHILLDCMQDPGNLGAIIRTASAFGIKSLILTGKCADIWNTKTIRASMGAIFRQRICRLDIHELGQLKENGIRFIGAVCHGDSGGKGTVGSIFEADLNDAVIAIGNEGQGLSEEVLSLCGEKIEIPIEPECESLNAAAAAAIIMWEARRKERGM
ncbi:MAG: RNA methyltransferase [Oscillospiraceae bacterium]|nr:RNA methyltransferase [Oscillospiraceae bacterium]